MNDILKNQVAGGLSTCKCQFSYDNGSQTTLSLVGTTLAGSTDHTNALDGKDRSSEEKGQSVTVRNPWHPMRWRQPARRLGKDVVEDGAHAHELNDVGQDGEGREISEVADRAHQQHEGQDHEDVVAVV